MLEFRSAVRHAVPLLISLTGVSGSGKTLSALLMAAGIAGKDGVVGMIDAENGRGELYADEPLVTNALGREYAYTRIDPPFSPEAYIKKLQAAERDGITVAVVDSFSHEWEGIGGGVEIAERNPIKGKPNWAKAKMEHKRLVYYALASKMHIIFCLRGREKVKYIESQGKTQVLQLGVQPITEKNFVFEMLISMRIEETTHHAVPLKAPRALASIFRDDMLINKEFGEKIQTWNQSGQVRSDTEQLTMRARAAAEQGLAEYERFFKDVLTRAERLALRDRHAEFRAAAEQASFEQEQIESGNIAPIDDQEPLPGTGEHDGTSTKPANVN